MVEPKHGNSTQIRYTKIEKEIIPQIGSACKTIVRANIKIGGLFHKLVEAKGGVKWGDKIAERVALHPDVDVSRQYVTKCWNLYRLAHIYRNQLIPGYKDLYDSSLMAIGRLLELDVSEATRVDIINVCIARAVDESMTVEDVKSMVSRRLEEFGQLKKRPNKPKKGAEAARKPAMHESDLLSFAESLSVMSNPDKFPAERLETVNVRNGIVRILNELVSITWRLSASNQPEEDLGNVLVKKGTEITKVGEQLLKDAKKRSKAA